MQYIISNSSLTFYDQSGKAHQVRSDHVNYKAIRDGLLNDNRSLDELINLADTVRSIQNHVNSLTAGKYLEKGRVRVTHTGVYYNGELVDSSLTQRMVRIISNHGDARPWIAFMEKLYTNPNHTTRFELYDWMSSCSLPLTDDGDFIAYKRVRGDYRDCHSGRFDNSVGQIVSLPDRSHVDPVRTNVCSRGLHFCSASYLPSFSGDRVMILKVNPADVVSIPTDYNFAKGRTWKYEVVGEIQLEDALTREWPAVVGANEYRIRSTESDRRVNDYVYS
jgi:hypothetical protein